MQTISREALTLPATPKGVTTLWATQLAFICVKITLAKNKQCHTVYLRGNKKWYKTVSRAHRWPISDY